MPIILETNNPCSILPSQFWKQIISVPILGLTNSYKDIVIYISINLQSVMMNDFQRFYNSFIVSNPVLPPTYDKDKSKYLCFCGMPVKKDKYYKHRQTDRHMVKIMNQYKEVFNDTTLSAVERRCIECA